MLLLILLPSTWHDLKSYISANNICSSLILMTGCNLLIASARQAVGAVVMLNFGVPASILHALPPSK